MKNGYPLEWGLWLNGREVPRGMGLQWNGAPVEWGPGGMKNGFRWNGVSGWNEMEAAGPLVE